MAVLHDVYCGHCDHEEEGVWFDHAKPPHCSRCGHSVRPRITHVNTDAWGGPRFIPSLDRTFDSHADLKSYMKRNHMEPAASADKHHGARNESHLGLGKLYSGAGIKKRSSYSRDYGKGTQ